MGKQKKGARTCPGWCSLWLLASIAVAVPSVLCGLAWQMFPEICCEVERLEPEPADRPITPRCPEVGHDIGSDLTIHGYTIVRSAMDNASTERMLAYADTLPFTDYFGGYRHPAEGKLFFEVAPDLWPMLQDVVKRVQAGSNITVAAPDVPYASTWKALEFLTTTENPSSPGRSVNFTWHQDFEAYYVSMQAYSYLNMYLVIDKSAPHEAGLSVVSMAHLRDRAPGTFRRIVDNAVTVWETTANPVLKVSDTQEFVRTHVSYDHQWVQDFRLDELSCTYDLVPGDLLIMRGDTPHKTQQPIIGRRTSLSVRLAKSNFSAADMWRGGMVKYARLNNNPHMFAWLMLKEQFGMIEGRELLPIEQFRAQWWIFLMRAGYRYRLMLRGVRCFTGELMGEKFCPIATF